MKVGNFSGTCSPLCNLMVHLIIRIWVCWLQLELNYLLQMSQYLSIGLPTLFLSNSDYYDDICLLNMILMQGSDEQLRNLSTDKILQKMKRGRSLCSRNFQNEKLMLDFVEIWSFYRHSSFTWNQVLANSNRPKCYFWQL